MQIHINLTHIYICVFSHSNDFLWFWNLLMSFIIFWLEVVPDMYIYMHICMYSVSPWKRSCGWILAMFLWADRVWGTYADFCDDKHSLFIFYLRIWFRMREQMWSLSIICSVCFLISGIFKYMIVCSSPFYICLCVHMSDLISFVIRD